MKFQYPILITTGLLLSLLSFMCSFSKGAPTSFENGKEIIIFRKVGHEILLNVGDNTSRVLPVKKINQDEFELRFENSFVFKPDSIISIIDRVFQQNNITKDYIVNVKECLGDQIIFGYAIIESEQDEIVPCNGRDLDENCYYVNIKFDASEKGLMSNTSFRVGLSSIGLLFVLIGVVKSQKKSKEEENESSNKEEVFQIGTSVFNVEEHFIINRDEKIKLTAKETKLLLILAKKQNQVVDRAELDEKVWNNEGVIVGRSLDIFISKLRKKLKIDPNITIINIYGKGYKLEVITP